MILVAAILLMLALSWLGAFLYLKRHEKIVSEAVSTCPECGGATTVTPDPPNSQLVVQCQANNCGCTLSRSVRASALSLFGVTLVLLTILAGVLGHSLAFALGCGPAGKAFAILLGIFLGGMVARFLVRLAAFALLQSKLPPAWQEEVVAYLAPPPFLTRKARAAAPIESANSAMGPEGEAPKIVLDEDGRPTEKKKRKFDSKTDARKGRKMEDPKS